MLSLAAIAYVAWHAGKLPIAFMATVLIASTLGFLRFNINPATMFLGDGGSLFLGFMISVLGVSWSNSHAPHTMIAVAIAILAVPLAETGVSILRRFLSYRSMFASDREHIHHMLLERGFSQRHVVFLLCSIAAVSGVAGIAMAIGSPKAFLVSASSIVLMVVAGILALGYAEFVEIARIVRRVLEQRRIVANKVILRKIATRISKSSCIGSLGDELRVAFSAMRFDGFELSLAPWFVAAVPCEARTTVSSWGITRRDRSFDSSCWTMGIDLCSEQHGSLGWIGLARAVDKGSLLFDANVIVEALQPAIITALEQCFSTQCHQNQAWVRQHPWVWGSALTKLPARIATVSDRSNSASL